MRFLKTGLLVLTMALLGAAQAQAYEFYLESAYAGETLAVNDTVVVDVFMDADTGLQILGMGVLYDATELAYDQTGSLNLPPQGPGTSGSQPSYILYTPGGGMNPATVLYPLQAPVWLPWPVPPPGKGQVNINFAESQFNPAVASGTGIWIGSFLFDVIDTGDGAADIELSLNSEGAILRSDNVELDPATIPINGTPITVITAPEPTAAALAVAACAMTAFLVRRRRA